MKFETDPMPREANLFEKPEHIQFIFESLIRCMQDADLPVRVWGALTLREYMNYEESKSRKCVMGRHIFTLGKVEIIFLQLPLLAFSSRGIETSCSQCNADPIEPDK